MLGQDLERAIVIESKIPVPRDPLPWTSWHCTIENRSRKCLNGEIFYSLKEAQVALEMWRKHKQPVRLA